MNKESPILDRNNPDIDPLIGNIKVTRNDWLNLAMDVLITDGVEQVKILDLAKRLHVSRSSFYWYFKSRAELLDALLKDWERTNTASLVKGAERKAETITQALCFVFEAFIDPKQFNTALDFAIRDWARRSENVRAILDRSDKKRLSALTAMYERFDYSELEAETRARILYYQQIGYNDADLHEPMTVRMKYYRTYLLGFTGVEPKPHEVEQFRAFALSLEGK